MKVAQLFKLYNFASMNIFKFWLHFEIWIWVHLSIWIISKLLQILYVNFKNFEYQSWSLSNKLQLCFLSQPQIPNGFWNRQKGQKWLLYFEFEFNFICSPFYLIMVFDQLHGPLGLFESNDTWSHMITWNLTLVVLIFIQSFESHYIT